jgi:hypothetical protein
VLNNVNGSVGMSVAMSLPFFCINAASLRQEQ